MDGVMLLWKARAAGLAVTVDGDRLRIRGPRNAEPIARQLLAHKNDVLDALQCELPPDWHFLWDERAAIREYDGKIPRERAEALALAEILELMGSVSSQSIYAGNGK